MKTMTEVMPILKAIRGEKNISIQEVVDYIQQEAGIKVATKTVYGWENLSSKPDVMCFVAMCNLYEIGNIQELFEDSKFLLRKPTLKDKLYDTYVTTNPDIQNAVRILLDM